MAKLDPKEYPELAKIDAFNETRTNNYRLLFEFVEFCKLELNITFAEAKYDSRDNLYFDHIQSDDRVIHKFLEIDDVKLEAERRKLLESVSNVEITIKEE